MLNHALSLRPQFSHRGEYICTHFSFDLLNKTTECDEYGTSLRAISETR